MNGVPVRCYSNSKDGAIRITPHFRVREFACKDGSDAVFISLELAELLERVRMWAGDQVIINSGYRTPTHNKAQGGSKYSQHLYGTAADIVVRGKTPAQVAAFVEDIMPDKGGIGKYKSFTHIDVRENRYRWDNTSGREIPVKGF